MEYSDERSAGELISRLVDTIGARDEKGVVPFVVAWPRLVGPDLAAHTRVLDVRNGAVHVGVDHPAWVQRIHFEQDRIVDAIQRRFPVLNVRYLRFTVASAELFDQLSVPTTGRGDHQDSASDRDTHPKKPAEPEAGDTPGSERPSETISAAEDEAFQRHLRGLAEALRKNDAR